MVFYECFGFGVDCCIYYFCQQKWGCEEVDYQFGDGVDCCFFFDQVVVVFFYFDFFLFVMGEDDVCGYFYIVELVDCCEFFLGCCGVVVSGDEE